MKKVTLSLLIIILLISSSYPVFADQTIIEDNITGNEIEEINYPEKMINNYGTIKSVNDGGNIENNYGVATNMCGSIINNYGTVDAINDKGSVYINEGLIKENNYYVNLNNPSGIIEENNYRVQVNQFGTIETNNSEVWNNHGIIKLNNSNGYIDDNYGTIENNIGTVLRNNYPNDNTLTNSVNNTEKGIVLENYAQVTGGTIEKNYSKDVRSTTINNNYSTEVGENVIIKRNFANSIANATIENQYYKLTIKGNIDFICKIDTNNNLEDNIYIDSEGQTWIRAEDAMFEVKAKRGHRIVGEINITADGATIVSKEDTRNVGFLNISGEIIIEAETEEIETFKVVFDANGGKFNSNRKDILTYEKWLPEDYEMLEIPIKDGYSFIGYFTEKEEGTSFDSYYNEAGVDKDMTLYAHWKENSSGVPGEIEQQPSNSENAGQPVGQIQPMTQPLAVSETTNNPPTGDNIVIWLSLLIISAVGLIFIKNKDNKNN